MARTCSSIFLKRVLNSVPWCSISSAFHPPPMPKRKRPFERASRLATALAVVIVSRSMTRQMPVPTLRCLVAAAAAISPTNGSWVRLYSSGSTPPANGLRRLVGMCVCSGTNSDSNFRASSSRARSSGRIERSVGKMQTPMSMGTSSCSGKTRCVPTSFSLDSSFKQCQRAGVGVELGEASDGQRGLVVHVADHQARDSRHSERMTPFGKNVLEHSILHERSRRLASRELAERHTGDPVEATREPELRQKPVDPIVGLVDVLEEQNRTA